MSGYQFIDQQRGRYPVRLLCRVLNVVPARYYAWRKQRSTVRPAPAPGAWEEALEKAFTRHQHRYGTRRLRVELHEQGYRVGRQRLRTALRARGLRALQPRAFTPRTTDSTHGLRCAPNRLLDQPAPTQPNQVWVSDITYPPLASGAWAYLCAFQDSFTRQVVGWQVRETMPEDLVVSALRRALLAREPGLVVHSDRGGQYCGNAYRALLAEHGCLRSQSRRAECLAMPRPKASGHGSKPKNSKPVRGPCSETWPVPDKAWLLILNITITNAATRHSPFKARKPFIFNNLEIHPKLSGLTGPPQ